MTDTDAAGSRHARPLADTPVDRLRLAVRDAGGPTAVAKRSGVPLGSLNKYLAGRAMSAAALIRLSAALDRRLDWLATGAEGLPRLSEDPAEGPRQPVQLDPALLAKAIEIVLALDGPGVFTNPAAAAKRIAASYNILTGAQP